VLRDVYARKATAFSPFELDTARASLIYRSFAGRACASQNGTRALQQALTVRARPPPVTPRCHTAHNAEPALLHFWRRDDRACGCRGWTTRSRTRWQQ